MKFITLAIAAVGVAAMPQTLQVPGTYTGCGTLISNCCKTAVPKFTECNTLLGAVPSYQYFVVSCTNLTKVPACCMEKKSPNLIEGFFNQVLGTSLGESQCILPPLQP
ncbi:hypothetical protein MAN_06142, partial [Metarhizium hybridum]